MGEGSSVPTPLLKGGPSDLLQVGSRVAIKPWPRVAEYHNSPLGRLGGQVTAPPDFRQWFRASAFFVQQVGL